MLDIDIKMSQFSFKIIVFTESRIVWMVVGKWAKPHQGITFQCRLDLCQSLIFVIKFDQSQIVKYWIIIGLLEIVSLRHDVIRNGMPSLIWNLSWCCPSNQMNQGKLSVIFIIEKYRNTLIYKFMNIT
jgi:hypothetical protein